MERQDDIRMIRPTQERKLVATHKQFGQLATIKDFWGVVVECKVMPRFKTLKQPSRRQTFQVVRLPRQQCA